MTSERTIGTPLPPIWPPDAPHVPPGCDRSVHTSVVPLTPPSYEFVFSLALEAGEAWNWGGRPPSWEGFTQSLWAGVSDQALVVDAAGNRVGLITMYGHNAVHRTASLRAYVAPSHRRLGWPLEAFALFIDRCVLAYDLRILYLEASEPRVEQFASVARTLFDIEGRLSDALLIDSVPQDLLILALHRARWETYRSGILRSVGAHRGDPPHER